MRNSPFSILSKVRTDSWQVESNSERNVPCLSKTTFTIAANFYSAYEHPDLTEHASFNPVKATTLTIFPNSQ